MPLTKIIGTIDLSGLSDEVKNHFLKRGQLVTDTDKGARHSLKDIVGKPIGLKEDNGKTYLLAHLYDGPDKTMTKARILSKNINNVKGRIKYKFKAEQDKLETWPGSDEWNNRMVVNVITSPADDDAIKIAPKKYEGFLDSEGNQIGTGAT